MTYCLKNRCKRIEKDHPAIYPNVPLPLGTFDTLLHWTFFFLTRLGVQLVIVLIPVLQFISTILSPFGIPTIVNCLCVYQVMESLFPDHTQISGSGLGGLGHEREHIMIYRFSS